MSARKGIVLIYNIVGHGLLITWLEPLGMLFKLKVACDLNLKKLLGQLMCKVLQQFCMLTGRDQKRNSGGIWLELH